MRNIRDGLSIGFVNPFYAGLGRDPDAPGNDGGSGGGGNDGGSGGGGNDGGSGGGGNDGGNDGSWDTKEARAALASRDAGTMARMEAEASGFDRNSSSYVGDRAATRAASASRSGASKSDAVSEGVEAGRQAMRDARAAAAKVKPKKAATFFSRIISKPVGMVAASTTASIGGAPVAGLVGAATANRIEAAGVAIDAKRTAVARAEAALRALEGAPETVKAESINGPRTSPGNAAGDRRGKDGPGGTMPRSGMTQARAAAQTEARKKLDAAKRELDAAIAYRDSLIANAAAGGSNVSVIPNANTAGAEPSTVAKLLPLGLLALALL